MAGRTPTRVRDTESVSPLFEACRTGNAVVVRQLATPENVNSRDVTGRKSTPLHFAAGKQKEGRLCFFSQRPSPSLSVLYHWPILQLTRWGIDFTVD